MSYLYKINIVVDEDEEDIQVQNTIDETVQKALMKIPFVEVVGEQIVGLDESVCGKCSCSSFLKISFKESGKVYEFM